jgi:hypothetical protein
MQAHPHNGDCYRHYPTASWSPGIGILLGEENMKATKQVYKRQRNMSCGWTSGASDALSAGASVVRRHYGSGRLMACCESSMNH